MKVRTTTPISATHGSYGAREVVDWPDDDVAGVLAAGFVEVVTERPKRRKPERATEPGTPETATEA